MSTPSSPVSTPPTSPRGRSPLDPVVTPPPSPQGVGGYRDGLSSAGGGGAPPPNPGIADLLCDFGKFCLRMFRELHRLVFYCPRETVPKKNPEVESVEKFLEKWAPQSVVFLLGVQPQDVKKQLEGIHQDKLRVLFEAFKTAQGVEVKSVDELVRHLPRDQVLKLTLPEGNEELYHSYGLTQDSFKEDIQKLPESIKVALKRFTGGQSLEAYFSENTMQLIALLKGYLPSDPSS